ncbi:hypothetical protein BBJ28_00007597 [Nothophytophthora sp. Chile5]|nr:hypothetical protein BBJ28_00007597 [Nothophytophthora sp. Chile5]
MLVPLYNLGPLVLASLPSRVMGDQAHATRREPEDRDHDLVKLLLPNDNPRVLKGKSPLWDKHFRQQQQLATARPIQACLLAHTHHLDVDELQKMRGNNQLALNRLKMQRILSRGGAFDDGSIHEEAKRKTTFLLRHFFAVDTGSYSPPQDQLLCDVVEDWACGDHATPDEISRLWESINNHLERSYLLRRKLVARSDPDVQSVRIAMNCLKKLPERLPEYRRVLDVVIAVVESGLFLANATAISPSPGDPTQDDSDLPSTRKRLYFEECKALRAVMQEEQAQQSKHMASIVSEQSDWQETSASLRQRIESLLNQFGDDQRQEKEALFVSFLRGNLDLLSSLACDEILQYFLGSGSAERKDAFSSLFIRKYGATETPRLLAEISKTQAKELRKFLHDNLEMLDNVLLEMPTALTLAVVEEFLLNHPRGLADLLLNRAPAIAVMFKAKPYILSGTNLLQACRPTLTKVLASTPEVLSYVIRTTPQLLSQIVREDVAVLSTVFASAPQCLGDVLEKHPEFFVNVAHRKPALVSRLFTEHPDLLLEPLEANPALLTTLLVYHRKILPAFSAPDFEPTLFKLQTKKLMQSSTQTCTSLTRASGKLRLREKMRQQGEELQAPLKTTSGKEITLAATPLPSAAVAQVPASVRAGASESIPTPVDIKSEIARMYVAKIAADKQDDTVNRKRQSLANFMQDLYILELGYKHLARKKLTNLLIGAKQVGDAPEATRVKWFRRFLNAMPSDRPLPPAALDFYLLVLQHIIPTGQLMLRLEEELFLVSQSALKTLVDDPLVSRLFDSKEQRQRVLNLQSAPTAARPDSSTSSSQPTLALLPVLCIDDLLDMVMKVWVQYQQR